MSNFGYTISKPRIINYDANDHSLSRYIYEQEPSFWLCIECGCCSAACTAGRYTSFSLREIHILIKRGENDKPVEKIRDCMLCGKCILVCPRGVNTRNVVFSARTAIKKLQENAV
ncbi:MAG: 4Fe-4S dicluster domain-containing protein [Bacteroidales bacterium]